MNAPFHSLGRGPLLLLCGAAAIALATFVPDFASASEGAMAPPVISLQTKKVTGAYKTTTKLPGQSSGGGGSGGAKKSGSNGSTVSDSKTMAWVEIQVRNTGDGPARGLTINSSVYVRATNISNSNTSVTWSKVEGSQTVDVDAGRTVTVVTDPVEKDSSISQTASSGKKTSSVTASVSNTDIVGWYIEAVFNNRVMYKSENPNGVRKQAEQAILDQSSN
jgi:hypothetical protein